MLSSSCFSKYPVDELLNAPESIEIDGREYVLETAIWRDYQPICPPDGQPLVAIVWVVATDSQPFSIASLDADYLWLVKDEDDVWGTDFEENETAVENFQLKKVARDGPKWGDGSAYPLVYVYVDAVVRLVDGEGSTYLLRAADQLIGFTY